MGSEGKFIPNPFLNGIRGEGQEKTIILNADGALLVLNMFLHREETSRKRRNMEYVVKAYNKVVKG